MDEITKLTIFRNHMVYNYKTHNTGKDYIKLGWANNYSPILDVTTRVKRIIPSTKRAILTIYGDNPSNIKYKSRNYPYPERSDREIVEGWLRGEHKERQTDPEYTYLYSLVTFPCKLVIEYQTTQQTTQTSQPTGSSNNTEIRIDTHTIFQNMLMEIVLIIILIGGYLLIKKK